MFYPFHFAFRSVRALELSFLLRRGISLVLYIATYESELISALCLGVLCYNGHRGSFMPYELRIYSANLGKIAALCARFRGHTDALFQKHGIERIGYWIEDASTDVLTYIIRHVGEPAKNWEAFLNDPVWIKAEKASEVAGPLVKSIESRYISPTDFSKLK